MFSKFHKGMLHRGVYLATSAYETGFISTQTGDEMIDEAIRAASDVLKKISESKA
jgi:glutamate-1-semialdehyde 2,1-aminomutase